MTRRGRVDLETLRRADGPVIDPEVPYGWVRASLLRDGRWRVAPPMLVEALAAAGRRDAAPLVLSPSRQHRHLNSLLADEPTEDGRQDAPEVLMHPADAAAGGVADGERVEVATADGAVVATVRVTGRIRRGAVSLPHGYLGTNVNDLTSSADLDPLTGMPVYSGVPVELSPL
jgi:anaerobic selenocysteine-containing dehydrogenase